MYGDGRCMVMDSNGRCDSHPMVMDLDLYAYAI
jgi:hypothetical protein